MGRLTIPIISPISLCVFFIEILHNRSELTGFYEGSKFSSYEIELRKMITDFELLTRKFL